MPEWSLRRPLLTAGVTILVAVIVLLSAFTLLARGTFTSARLTETLSSGWVAVGVRAPEGAGGVVTVLPVGGDRLRVQALRMDAATDALSVNDAHGLSQVVGDGLRRPMAGAIILDRLAFAGLVDAVDGIDVVLDHDLVIHRVDGGIDLIDAGSRHLDGVAAATFVLSDPQGVQLHEAMLELLGRLPADPDRLSGLVRSLGYSVRATVSAATIAQWLAFWQGQL